MREAVQLTDIEILLVQALDALAVSGASQAIRKSGTTSLANVNGASSSFTFSEVPSGLVNGSNTTYTLAQTPTSGTLELYMNGIRQKAGSGNDYTLSGLTITMSQAPEAGSVLLADYQY